MSTTQDSTFASAHTSPSSRRVASQGNAEPGSTRIDLYTAPHKGLRFMFASLLVAMGRVSFGDPKDVAAILAELEVALWACDDHIEHEDRHVRPALAERAPSAIATLDTEHAEHAQHVAELRSMAAALRSADTTEARVTLGGALYLHLSVFVAELLAHMAYEERVVQPLLDRLFSTEELQAIHLSIVGSIAPEDMLVWLRAMVPAASREGRVELLAPMKANAPPEAFAGVLHEVRPLLRPDDWSALARTLHLDALDSA